MELGRSPQNGGMERGREEGRERGRQGGTCDIHTHVTVLQYKQRLAAVSGSCDSVYWFSIYIYPTQHKG